MWSLLTKNKILKKQKNIGGEELGAGCGGYHSSVCVPEKIQIQPEQIEGLAWGMLPRRTQREAHLLAASVLWGCRGCHNTPQTRGLASTCPRASPWIRNLRHSRARPWGGRHPLLHVPQAESRGTWTSRGRCIWPLTDGLDGTVPW